MRLLYVSKIDVKIDKIKRFDATEDGSDGSTVNSILAVNITVN